MNSLAAYAMAQANYGCDRKVFDWDKAARLIVERKPAEASAGLSQDWEYTGGVIYRNGQPDLEDYTYLSSNWATPEIDLDGEVIPCFRMQSECPEWDSKTKRPESALAILRGATP
jgi:hypothetical protein